MGGFITYLFYGDERHRNRKHKIIKDDLILGQSPLLSFPCMDAQRDSCLPNADACPVLFISLFNSPKPATMHASERFNITLIMD